MKKKVSVFVLVMLAFLQPLMAQENGFSASVGFLFNSTDDVQNKDTGDVYVGDSIEMGLNLNLMFFKDSNFGYYINIYALASSILPLNAKYGDGRYEYAGSSYSSLGLIPGIGYKKEINDYLSFFAGIGPEIRLEIISDGIDYHTDKTQFGIGLSGILEARLQLYKRFSFAGGVLISSNFFERMNRNINAYPYIGFGWN